MGDIRQLSPEEVEAWQRGEIGIKLESKPPKKGTVAKRHIITDQIADQLESTVVDESNPEPVESEDQPNVLEGGPIEEEDQPIEEDGQPIEDDQELVFRVEKNQPRTPTIDDLKGLDPELVAQILNERKRKLIFDTEEEPPYEAQVPYGLNVDIPEGEFMLKAPDGTPQVGMNREQITLPIVFRIYYDYFRAEGWNQGDGSFGAWVGDCLIDHIVNCCQLSVVVVNRKELEIAGEWTEQRGFQSKGGGSDSNQDAKRSRGAKGPGNRSTSSEKASVGV
jgi:hypothetical protein